MSLVSKIPIAVIGLVAIVGGLGTGMAASLSIAGDPGLAGEAGPGEGEEPAEPLEIYEIGDFMVNLSEPGGARLLRMRLAVEASNGTHAKLERLEPRVRDELIRYASDQTYAKLEGAVGKEQLRADLAERINVVLEPERIETVFFHSFVVR